MGFGLYQGGTRHCIEIVECGPPAPVGSRGAALQPVVGRDARLLAQYARRYPLNGSSFFAYWQGG